MSTNRDAARLSSNMKRLSLATNTALPPSSPAGMGYADEGNISRASTSMATRPQLRRTPSSTSLGSPSRSNAPKLRSKSSMSSLKSAGGATSPRSPIARRRSSNFADIQAKSPAEDGAPPLPPLPLTAVSVANTYLEKDLAQHAEAETKDGMVVIVHDSCYGHRYSRPRTSKANLSTIVERPERLLATVMGISSAYVLLGGRHMGGESAPHPDTAPGAIPFKVQKSTRFVPLISPVVTSVHGTKWMNELKMMCEGAEAKLAANGKELTRPAIQISEGQEDERPHLHEGDLYLCSESLNALEGALGGVLDAVDAVFSPEGPNRAFVGIRPPGHHCSDDYPSGFCWLNNVHVGISHAASVHGLTHAAIIDFDLHHGDGSQTIAWAHNAKVASLPKNAAMWKRTAIGYFSIHDINSFPCEWGDEEKVKNASLCIENAHGQNIWNVHLQPWKTNEDFWRLYETRYCEILEKTRAFLERQKDRLQSSNSAPRPRAAIFISAGFDASEWEGQGMQRHKVYVPTDFYARFTEDIIKLSNEQDLGVDGRVISVLEGGYSDRALTSGVLSHLSGMAATNISHATRPQATGLAASMSVQVNGTNGVAGMTDQDRHNMTYDPDWWSPNWLEELEFLVNPPPPNAPRKPKGPINPNYSTPTQSFVNKAVPTARKSFAGARNMTPATPTYQGPPPEVSWAVAAQEFSKLLTPDRQTTSCKPEDLNAEATRQRQNRQSAMAIPDMPTVEEGSKMQLRGRKPKGQAEADSRPSSRSSRRKTIDILGTDNGDSDGGSAATKKPARRRVSVASTILSAAEDAPEPPPKPQLVKEEPSALRPASSTSIRSNTPADRSKGKQARSNSKQRASKKAPGSSTASVKSNSSSTGFKPDDVDSLTSGVKKMSIKLNMPTKEQQEAREAARKKPARAPARAPKKAATTTKAVKGKQTSSQPPTPVDGQPVPAPPSSEPPQDANSLSGRDPLSAVASTIQQSQAAKRLSGAGRPAQGVHAGLSMISPTSSYSANGPRGLPTPSNFHNPPPPPAAEPPSAEPSLPPHQQFSAAPPGPVPLAPAPSRGIPAFAQPAPIGAGAPAGGGGGGAASFLPRPSSFSGKSGAAMTPPRRATREDLPVFTASSPIRFGGPARKPALDGALPHAELGGAQVNGKAQAPANGKAVGH